MDSFQRLCKSILAPQKGNICTKERTNENTFFLCHRWQVTLLGHRWELYTHKDFWSCGRAQLITLDILLLTSLHILVLSLIASYGTLVAPICWVIPPASPSWTFVRLSCDKSCILTTLPFLYLIRNAAILDDIRRRLW